jgi:SAM-dependent methyltransferase
VKTLNWTGYVYGGLAHSTHIQYDAEAEKKGRASVCRGLRRMGLDPQAIAGWRVMDTGTGCYSLGLRSLGADVEHRDISLRTVEALNAYAQSCGYVGLRSIHTDLDHDPLPPQHFDLIYLSGVFQVFNDPPNALANLSRSLKAGGYLYLDIYRSGYWRWFVVDVLRRIVERHLLHDVVSRFAEFAALGRRRAFDLRQMELLVDDLFVERLHLLHPDDVKADAELLGLELLKPVTSMELEDTGERANHGLFYAHVFNTLIFRKTGSADGGRSPGRTRQGRCQIGELEGLSGSYRAVAGLTSEFLLAHAAGRFPREQTVSQVVNLFRMCHPCLPGDPYLESGRQEPPGSRCVASDEDTLARRHGLWCTFLANALEVANPLPMMNVESLGYELVRFLPEGSAR